MPVFLLQLLWNQTLVRATFPFSWLPLAPPTTYVHTSLIPSHTRTPAVVRPSAPLIYHNPFTKGGDVETSNHDGARGGERLERRQRRHLRRRARLDHQRATGQDTPQQNKTVRASTGVVRPHSYLDGFPKNHTCSDSVL